jgi:hypothetical protein
MDDNGVSSQCSLYLNGEIGNSIGNILGTADCEDDITRVESPHQPLDRLTQNIMEVGMIVPFLKNRVAWGLITLTIVSGILIGS